MKIHTPAKINLFLAVTGKRSDGYHDLRTLMCPIGLYDTISLDVGRHETRVRCAHPSVPEDHTNLAHRAADLFFQSLPPGVAPDGVGARISLEKRIPVAGGLGGGSGNAAGVLTALNRYFRAPFSRGELRAMGLRLGADVPFFIFGKPAFAAGVGEKLVHCPGLPPCFVLLITQKFAVSTGRVFKKLNLALTKCEKKFKEPLLTNGGLDIVRYLCNDLESVTIGERPVVQEAKTALMEQGALGALMSGSGPTVFGLFNDAADARRAQEALEARWRGQMTGAALLARA
ncbi:MAG: 4-(cytidine 5'-diphospho)-2-C-methyl-D-erythritol kinase [Desulfobacterales bacterium]|nr:4-(cytidine 5'-diphospho)-2-C-methyl-D-erythritol kinase [Desulfobacterales bacterium]